MARKKKQKNSLDLPRRKEFLGLFSDYFSRISGIWFEWDIIRKHLKELLEFSAERINSKIEQDVLLEKLRVLEESMFHLKSFIESADEIKSIIYRDILESFDETRADDRKTDQAKKK